MPAGSLINRLQANSKQLEPKIGMGVTVHYYTDRKAGTIRNVSPDGKRLWFTFDKATRTDSNGMSECQEYQYEDQPHSKEVEAYLNKKGRWKIRKSTETLAIGFRNHYHDFSF